MFYYFENVNLSGAIQQQHMVNAIAHFLKINDFADSVMDYVSEKVMRDSELMQQIRIALMNYGKSDEFAMLVFQKEQAEQAVSSTHKKKLKV